MSKFFVAGISGHVGGAAAEGILSQGHQVRTLHRNPEKLVAWSNKGVEVHQGDLNDPVAVASAFEGVAGAFILIPPITAPSEDFSEAKTLINSYTQALRKTTPPRLVVLSSFGSEHSSGLGLIKSTSLLETALNELNLSIPIAYMRAGGFMENYYFPVKTAEATGVLKYFAPTTLRVPMIATADIGAQVAKLLVDQNWSGKKIVEIGTPHTIQELAETINKLTGRPIEAQTIPREQWPSVVERFGIPPGKTHFFEEMMDGINANHIKFGYPGAESVPGTTTLSQYFEKVIKGEITPVRH